MKDIGSIFPIYANDLQVKEAKKQFPNRMHYSLCREALLEVAEHLGGTTVLLPAYTCDTVYLPFKQLGCKCVYYSVNRDLTSNVESIMRLIDEFHPDLVIFHPYFGRGFIDAEKKCIECISNQGVKILVDNTQCIFSEERLKNVDYYVGSYRKWFPMPDGGFLENYTCDKIVAPTEENMIFCALQKGAMYLRGEYFLGENESTKQLSIYLNKAADLNSVGKIEKHCMSDFSEAMLNEQNFQECIATRFSNFKYLLEHLNRKHIRFAVESIEDIQSAPLYFAIYVDDRQALQKHLAGYHIYLPIIWPVDDKEVFIDSEVKYIYDHILCIPIDQRYDINDMDKVSTLINEFYD